MDYTQSPQFVLDAGTGQNMHEENQATTTVWSDKDANSLIWSLMELVKAGGHTGLQFDEATPGTYRVLLKALKAAFGGNVTTVNFANSPFVLTHDHAGLVLLDGTAGNVSATLPAAALLTETALKFRFVRLDATANTATVSRAGADTFVGGATSISLSGQSDFRAIESDSASKWTTTGLPSVSVGFGQCQLTKSGANLVLVPLNGNRLTIGGVVCTVPSAGVSLAPPAVASTTYYIYAYMNGAVMTLENSATAPATDATTGTRIKTGDATRTLVGMARTTAANAWADTATQRFVASWFNRFPRVLLGAFTAGRSTASTTPIELNTEIRVEFLTWADELTDLIFGGCINSSSNGANSYAAVAIDSTTVPSGLIATSGSSVYNPLSAEALKVLAEGYHYATALGWASSTTANFGNGTNHNNLQGVIG